MKLTLAAFLIFVSLCCVHSQEQYTDKYDGMDLDQILANKRLINAYVKCIQGTGKCTPEGRYLKTHITDALQTGCQKCTDAQQQGIRKVVKYMITNEKKIWEQLVALYDPKGVYSKKYSDELTGM